MTFSLISEFPCCCPVIRDVLFLPPGDGLGMVFVGQSVREAGGEGREGEGRGSGGSGAGRAGVGRGRAGSDAAYSCQDNVI